MSADQKDPGSVVPWCLTLESEDESLNKEAPADPLNCGS